MPNTHIKIRSTSIAIKIVQIKTVRYHMCYQRSAKSDNTKHCQENGKELHIHTYLVFTMFQFMMLHRSCVFYKLKVWATSVSSKSLAPFFPIALAHFVFLCHILALFTVSQTFASLLYCYGDL